MSSIRSSVPRAIAIRGIHMCIAGFHCEGSVVSDASSATGPTATVTWWSTRYCPFWIVIQ